MGRQGKETEVDASKIFYLRVYIPLLHTYPPLGCSPAEVMLGPEVSRKRARATEGVWRRPYSCAELALGYDRAGGDGQRQGENVPLELF